MSLIKRNHGFPTLFDDELYERLLDPFNVKAFGYGGVRQSQNEEEGTVSLHFDVPGVDKDNVKINFDARSGNLSIVAEQDDRRFQYARSVSHIDFDSDSIKASHNNGVLTVTFKRQDITPIKQIEVE